MTTVVANAGTIKAEISLPSAKLAAGDISNVITICAYRSSSEPLGCVVTPVVIADGTNSSVEIDVSFIDSGSPRYHHIITQCTSNCAGFGAEALYFQFNRTFRPGRASVFENRFPTRLDIVLPEIYDLTINLPDAQVANGDIVNTLQVCEGRTCELEFLVIEDGTSSAATQFIAYSEAIYSLKANCLVNCDGYLNNSERWFQGDGTWSFNPDSFRTEGVANPIEQTLFETLRIGGHSRLPNGELATVRIGSIVTVCSYDDASTFLGCIQRNIRISAGLNEGAFALNVIDAGINGEYSVSTRCNSRCTPFLEAQQNMKPDGSFVFGATARVSASKLAEGIDIELARGDTLPVRITIAGGKSAESDEEMMIKVCSFDGESGYLGCAEKTVTLLQGSSLLEFDLEGVVPIEDGGSYSIIHKITDHSHDYERYFNDDGTSTPFLKYDYDGRQRPLITKNNLPATLDIELWAQRRITGSVNFPELQGRPPFPTGSYSYEVSLLACSFDDNDIRIYCITSYFDERFLVVNQDFLLKVPEVERTAYYTLSFSCGDRNCASRLTHYDTDQYLHNDGTFGYAEEKVLPENLPRTAIELILAFNVGDTDGDSIIDEFDNCLRETNHLQEDIDGDGKGNKCDTDDDGDGMPDSWEILRGLNPNVANADDDPDGDGFSNLREYELGFDPLAHDTDDNDNGISDKLEHGLSIVPLLKILLLKKNK